MKRLVYSLVLCAAACNHGGSQHGVIVDADMQPIDGQAIIDAPPPGPTMVTIQVYGSPPTFARYRAGTGPWAVPTMPDASDYQFPAADAYEFVAVCAGSDGSLDETEVAATVSGDGTTNAIFCETGGDGGTPPATVAITGTMSQAGNVQMVDTMSSTTPSWSFTLNVPPSTQDFVALDGSAMEIQRDLSITAPEDLGTIDLATDGTPMLDQPITTTGVVLGDTVTTSDDLYTANDDVDVSEGSDAASIQLVPTALLAGNDEEVLAVEALNDTSFSELETIDPTVTQFDLLPRLTGVAFTTTGAGWTTLPAGTEDVEIGLYGSTDAVEATVDATASWIAQANATGLDFDGNEAPGWQDAWSFWSTQAYTDELDAAIPSQTSYAITGSFTSADGFVRRAMQKHRHAEQVLRQRRHARR